MLSCNFCDADDKFFMYAMMFCCIAASVLLIMGVIKVRRKIVRIYIYI